MNVAQHVEVTKIYSLCLSTLRHKDVKYRNIISSVWSWDLRLWLWLWFQSRRIRRRSYPPCDSSSIHMTFENGVAPRSAHTRNRRLQHQVGVSDGWAEKGTTGEGRILTSSQCAKALWTQGAQGCLLFRPRTYIQWMLYSLYFNSSWDSDSSELEQQVSTQWGYFPHFLLSPRHP